MALAGTPGRTAIHLRFGSESAIKLRTGKEGQINLDGGYCAGRCQMAAFLSSASLAAPFGLGRVKRDSKSFGFGIRRPISEKRRLRERESDSGP